MALTKIFPNELGNRNAISKINLALTSVDANSSAIAVIKNVTAPAGSYTVATTVSKVLATTGTITLYAASGNKGEEIIVKNIGASVITVDGDGSETIDGETTADLNINDSIQMISDDSNWRVI